MSDDTIRANLFGNIDYAALTEAIAFVESGEPFSETISVSSNQTQTFDFDLGENKASIIFIQVLATQGTTDVDVSVHESTNYNKADKVYGVTSVSFTDTNPTGGPPAQGGGIPYVDATENEELHVKTVENSGNNGTVILKFKYI